MEPEKIDEFAEDQAQPASLQRIFFARVIDLIISLVPALFIALFYHAHDVKSAAIIVCSSFAILFFYFILLAYWCHGNTIGKLMLGIKVKHKNDMTKPKFREVFGREFYHILVPWFLQLILQIVVVLIAYYENPTGENNYYSTLCYTLQNIGTLFYFLWFIYVGLTIKSQADHQSGVDYKFHLVCYYQSYQRTAKKPEPEIKHHVHLDESMPGNFDVGEIDKLLEEKKDDTE